ncbi:hypothetical protein TRIATDRAFT_289269 [Trichoderma atroviride IMI 206040]|uniref:Uncharacterized protein n=1 Tax=Hypocrea atroviridis (strain ATCC 20476 / IMI 206040) TaxID=452589 RepID=G9NGW6_HYPAI|nr:uncharacterized protein TRIATDRAFT_254598 [Trichoderma atroviride IMI 206040]EHK49866.1 hypothetical protein TRIATDRAFT_289269 [Trichoderma atroviride IMI 206040]
MHPPESHASLPESRGLAGCSRRCVLGRPPASLAEAVLQISYRAQLHSDWTGNFFIFAQTLYR